MSQQQKLVLSIIDFLNKSIEDGTVKQDDKESLEVAIQCIAEAFGVDPLDQQQVERLSIKPASLQSIFDLFLKTREKVGSPSQASTSAASQPAPPTAADPSTEDKAVAEKHKQAGNAQMSSKNYDEAIDSYSKAIELDSTNPVYYSNRAAAYSSKSDHLSAIADATKAIEVDSSFTKAYHRLGHAQYSLADYKEAAAAFKRGLEIDPGNASLASGLSNAEARITNDDLPTTTTQDSASTPGGGAGAPDFNAMADMMRNMGGDAGGAGGLGGLLNNPMMMQMAQQMMANGGMERLMQNPSVANMMNRAQSGGGMPSMQELMSDPALRDLAGQFGGGGR